MISKTNTGGLKEFVYPKDYQPRLSHKDELDIGKGYEDARKRKLKNRRIKYLIIGLILFVGVLYLILK